MIPPTEVHERPGLGVVADIEGRRAVLGRRELLADLGVQLEPEPDAEETKGRRSGLRWELSCSAASCSATSRERKPGMPWRR